ncbi:hypothetical protein K474DRAFT_1558274, partial [Panus rudis PR-1116 ss-1]
MENLPSLVISHPGKTYISAASVFALLALTPSPSFIPTIALITIVRLAGWAFAPRPRSRAFIGAQIVSVAFFAAIAQLTPSLEALSTPSTALVVLSAISALTSAISSTLIIASSYAARLANTPWTRLTVFPALWATGWGFLSYISPVGQLATWSPVVGLGPYWWIRQYFGQWGVDWITAAWASILSLVVGDWLMGVQDEAASEQPLIQPIVLIDEPEDANETVSHSPRAASIRAENYSKLGLFCGLIFLMIPGYVISDIPLPAYSDETTPYVVGCALPVPRNNKGRISEPTLKDYLYESRTLQASADIVLWPESAVKFDSPAEKEDAFKLIQLPGNLNEGKYWGISFEEYIPANSTRGMYARGVRRNGFALLGSSGPPVFEYYKRKLVPVAESFSLSPAFDDPPVVTVPILRRRYANRPQTSLPVTASICLDFASSSSFEHLTSRPAFILAPARTWQIGVGYAMWEQAKARALETGSDILWCDGGEGGVSGIAGGGYHEVVQVGQGSWYKAIGIHAPYDEHPPIFIRIGKYGAFAVAWAV